MSEAERDDGSGMIEVEVHGMIAGFPATFRKTMPAGKVQPALAFLMKHCGFAPPPGPPPAPTVYETTADGVPICPKHRCKMKRREKQGNVWHNHEVYTEDGRGSYCAGYDGADSPGYHVEDFGPPDKRHTAAPGRYATPARPQAAGAGRR